MMVIIAYLLLFHIEWSCANCAIISRLSKLLISSSLVVWAVSIFAKLLLLFLILFFNLNLINLLCLISYLQWGIIDFFLIIIKSDILSYWVISGIQILYLWFHYCIRFLYWTKSCIKWLLCQRFRLNRFNCLLSFNMIIISIFCLNLPKLIKFFNFDACLVNENVLDSLFYFGVVVHDLNLWNVSGWYPTRLYVLFQVVLVHGHEQIQMMVLKKHTEFYVLLSVEQVIKQDLDVNLDSLLGVFRVGILQVLKVQLIQTREHLL